MESHMAKEARVPERLREPKDVKNIRPYSWWFRNSVQLGVFLLTIGIGLQFFIYVLQASGDGPVTLSRPPGVKGD